MKKIISLLILGFTFNQTALAGHHPIEPDDNSGIAFLIGLGIILLIAVIIYFFQKKSK